jgi:peptidoglycan/LPS O-acetylase OafA/YrhL
MSRRAAAADAEQGPTAGGRLQLLDVLRGVSIAIVLASHTIAYTVKAKLPPWLTPLFKGELGVGIFFVISGFIITKLLLEERRETGAVDLRSFYVRRASKLCPVLLLYCALIALSASFIPWQGCPPWAYATSALFLTELFPVSCWPIQHTWSLSVEELFYLSWAPLMVWRSERFALRVALGAVVVAPLVRLFNHSHQFPKHGFVAPFEIPFFQHVDYLAIGCLAALALNAGWRAPRVVRLIANPFVAPVIVYVATIPYHVVPGLQVLRFLSVPFSATLQALAVGCVLWQHAGAGARTQPSQNILVRAAAGLGLVSYSLYVWQQFFLTQTRVEVHWVQRFPYNLGIALIFGIGSFLLIEEPCRKALRRRFSTRRAREPVAAPPPMA